MKKISNTNNKEQGVVSILSVIFFIILMSVLTVSFLRIVTDEQDQVIDDDLSKGALAAAQSGVEDAKRALLYCRANPAAGACAQLSNKTCPGIFTAGPSGDLRTALGLNAQADGSIQVGDLNSNNNQRYTCVTVDVDTNDYQSTADENSTELIPLRGVAGFNQVRFSWRQPDGVATPAPIPTTSEVPANSDPRRPTWKDAGGTSFLAVPRLQFINFDRTLSLYDMRNNSSGMFLFPYTGTGSSSITLGAISPGALVNKHVAVDCAGAQADYRCTATINVPTPTSNQEYYLAVKSVYGPTVYKVELLNSNTGTGVAFNNVQPEVDSTGAAANIYKRLISRVTYKVDSFLTTNVIESGGGICKDFYVTRTTVNEDTSTCLGF